MTNIVTDISKENAEAVNNRYHTRKVDNRSHNNDIIGTFINGKRCLVSTTIIIDDDDDDDNRKKAKCDEDDDEDCESESEDEEEDSESETEDEIATSNTSSNTTSNTSSKRNNDYLEILPLSQLIDILAKNHIDSSKCMDRLDIINLIRQTNNNNNNNNNANTNNNNNANTNNSNNFQIPANVQTYDNKIVNIPEHLQEKVRNLPTVFYEYLDGRNFQSRKRDVCKILFAWFDAHVFQNKLADHVTIDWENRSKSRAGCFCRKGQSSVCPILLSNIILIDTKRLVRTLAHEMCHAAVHFIDQQRERHGKCFKKWCKNVFEECGVEITTTHSYEISYKHIWKCSNTNCTRTIKKHRNIKRYDNARCRCKAGVFTKV